jgi:UrcA family protein
MKTKTFTNTKRITLATIAALTLSTAAIGAYAAENPARTVHYSDLDLGTQAGATVLYNRIRQAAEQVCGNPDLRQLAETAAAKACIHRAVSTSVHAVNNPRLTNVYDARIGVKTISVAALR